MRKPLELYYDDLERVVGCWNPQEDASFCNNCPWVKHNGGYCKVNDEDSYRIITNVYKEER